MSDSPPDTPPERGWDAPHDAERRTRGAGGPEEDVPEARVPEAVALDAPASSDARPSLGLLDRIDAGDAVEAPPPPAADAGPEERPEEGPEGGHDDGGDVSFLSAVRDHVEAVAFALVLALLLRLFCVEVFRIPTSSMEPTLFGDKAGDGGTPGSQGDRVFVDKARYLVLDPERFEIAVFRYPLDASRNFIKRIAGLPDERLRILLGDVWSAPAHGADRSAPLRIARKPRRVREELYVPCYPPKDDVDLARPSDYWRTEGDRGPTIEVRGAQEFAYRGDAPDADPRTPAATLRYGFRLTNETSVRYGSTRDTNGFGALDVRVRLRAEVEGSAEIAIAWEPGDGRHHEVRLATQDRGGCVLAAGVKRRPLGVALVPGRPMDVELESVDGAVHAWIDGDEAAVVEDDPTFDEAVRTFTDNAYGRAQRLTITARGSPLVLRDARVDRDLYYLGSYERSEYVPARDQDLVIPPGHYFMLGDNTGHSSDARLWTAHGRRLRDGSVVWWESDHGPTTETVGGERRMRVIDVDGVARTWTEEEQDPDALRLSERRPFVAREALIGRAFFAMVFWPLDGSLFDRFRLVR